MATNSIIPIIIVAGPTASGKSALALSIAEKTGGVIINADSQQLYRELPILTARPSPQEEARISHRLYGIVSASDGCSAGKWLTLARMEIDWARSQGKQPVVVGGTGLYLKALMQGIADIPAIPPQTRAQAVSDYEQMGREAFASRLREVDAGFFERLKAYDRQRLIRAWEVWLSTGRPLSWWQGQGAVPPYPAGAFELRKVELPRDEIYRRCDARFLKMVEQGAVEEVMAALQPDGIAGIREKSSLT
ncbi:MAG: tRNA (adenosine(37)-N6)-dimethylallyltransferase MiaA, partial [Pseudomonadota bacterium]|nr:tRNA (adenosine(37)-N6)-dimethylallyltransferase MiaA [Pseudomonadota bacterium]